MEQIVYQGKIWTGTKGENDDALFVGYTSEPFAEVWQDKFGYSKRKQVTVRYWVSDTEKTKEQLKENLFAAISGSVEADYGDAYSEITGYLWTTEKLKVGGHDLLEELQSYIGKFLYMEVDY